MDWPLILTGAGASAAAGMATGLGTLPLAFIRTPSERLTDALLGFAAGVMLAAAFFSLIVPGLAQARSGGASGLGSAAIVGTAIMLGALALAWVNRHAPHEHFVIGRYGPDAPAMRRVWLFVIAITLHNVPEGLAVGVSFGGGDMARGSTTALAIGLQNVPEGLAVAIALTRVGYSRIAAAAITLATGLIEPIGGTVGITAVSVSNAILPWGLGFAGGAMVFVVSSEIIPETHRRGHEAVATMAFMVGLVVMMLLDVSFA